MKVPLPRPLFLLASFVVAIQAKIYEHCELAKKLDDYGLDGYQGYSLANWICLAFFVSGFDTEAVEPHKDGTTNYGIFQINSGWWCADKSSASDNLCDIDCKDLLGPDIENNVRCAQRISRESQGMAAWDDWKTHCEHHNLTKWVKGCRL